MVERIYTYSEIFHSAQGEGKYTGVPTAWLRFFLCNLQCNGFGQKNPKDPSTYILPYQDIDVSKYNSIEQLPVLKYGCDSAYSWAKKFRHLQRRGTVADICNKIRESMFHPSNPAGKFGSVHHMCFTGGEPLLAHGQEAAIAIIDHFFTEKDFPKNITWETNGTQKLTSEFVTFFDQYHSDEGDVFFSVSPKLFSVSGETPEKAICPEIVAQYYHDVSRQGQLKFVINGTQDSWDEMEDAIRRYRAEGVLYPVWVMPVSATPEGARGQLPNYIDAGKIATEAVRRGYNVAARVHVYLWNNAPGT